MLNPIRSRLKRFGKADRPAPDGLQAAEGPPEGQSVNPGAASSKQPRGKRHRAKTKAVEEPMSGVSGRKRTKRPLKATRHSRFLMESATVAIVLSSLFASYLAWRLSIGTISISATTPYVEDVLSRLVGGTTRIGSLRLGWDREARDFVVLASQITARTDQRTSPLRLGQVDLTLDAPSLLIGKAVVKQASLAGVEAVLVVDREGRTAFGFGSAEEVLALPRIKGAEGGLARILKATRQALDPAGQAGRVAQVVLREARLQLIDPDSGQRLVLERARAGLFRNDAGIVTLQASGQVRNAQSSMNVAIAAPPDPRQGLVLVTQVAGMRLSQLPLSLRGERLSELASWTSPLSGRAMMRLTPEGSPMSIMGDLRLGQGRAGGIGVNLVEGSGAWARDTGIIRLDRLNIKSDRIEASGVSGQFFPASAGRRRIEFAAESFAARSPAAGSVQGRGASGKLILSDDLRIVSADMTAKGFGLAHANSTTITLLDATVSLVAAGPAGRMRGDQLSSVLAGGQVRMTARSTGLALSDKVGGFGTGGGVDIALVRAGAGGPWEAQASLANLNLAGRGLAIPQTRARGLSLAWRGTDAFGAGEMAVQIQAASTTQTGVRGLGLAGSSMALSLSRTPDANLLINRLEADSFAFVNPIVSLATGSVTLTGRLGPEGLTGATLKTPQLTLTNPAQLARPFVATQVDIAGDVVPKGVRLSHVHLNHRGIDAVGQVEVGLSRRGSAKVFVDTAIDGEIDVHSLMAAWPRAFLPDVRNAIEDVVKEGIGKTDRLVLRVPEGLMKGETGPDDMIDLDFTVRDATVQYLPQMTALTELSGRAELTGSSFSVAVDHGKLADLTLTNSRFAIPKFRPRETLAEVEAKVSGSVATMVAEADREPLQLLSKAQFDPTRLDGEGNLDLRLAIPLSARLRPEQVSVQARGQFEQASLQNAFAGLEANDGTVALKIDDGRIEVAGQAWLAGNPFDFTWRSEPGSAGQTGTQLKADGRVDLASLNQIGIDVTSYATGPVRLRIDARARGPQFVEADLDADLTSAIMKVPGGLWAKPEGSAGQANARVVTRTGGGWLANDVRFDAQGARVRGGLALSEQLDLVAADFTDIAIDRTANLALEIRDDAEGLHLAAHGAYLNLSPFLVKRDVSERTVQLLKRPVSLDATIQRLETSPSSGLDQVQARLLRDTAGWRELALTGQSLTGATHVMMVPQVDGRRTITGTLSDAGFFAGLLYPGAPLRGGTGSIDGELPGLGTATDMTPQEGRLMVAIKDISYMQLPQSPVIFDQVRLPMRLTGGIISLREGKADGSAYTLKASGYVDLEDGKLDIRGVVTPGGLNRALGDVPLFGGLLGGGQDEGLVGVTFSAKGDLANPKLRTNPISALAPGFLRRLFETEAPLEPPPKLKPASIPTLPPPGAEPGPSLPPQPRQ